jgi:two-component system KDP operon response regulator KdpE
MQKKPRKILIIEDNEGIVNTLSAIFQLRYPELQLISTNNGYEGLDAVTTGDPDLVILDLGLPDIDGFDVLKKIRRFSSVPIIICTARAEHTDMVKGVELGADDYIVKPFKPIYMLNRIWKHLRE